MKGLEKLIRIKKQQLDEKRRQLAALQAVATGFSAQIGNLESAMAQESRTAGENGETAPMFGGFAQASLTRRETLVESLQEATMRVTEAETDIAAAFRDLKKCELLQERQDAREQDKRRRRDRAAEDDLAISMFRNKAALQAG